MKVAIIGAGFGRYAMAPVYQKLGFEVEVVTPRDAEAVERALASNVDLVSVHSPPFMHHAHVMRALDHGHAVLCDKPFGRNATEARAMRDRARELGVLNFVNFETRWKPNRAKIKQLVDEGAIGAPRHLNWTFFSNGFRAGPHGWINERELGGGWIGAYASHCIDIVRWLFGSEVARCGGISRIEVPTRSDKDGAVRTATAEDAYSAWFIMQNGCTAAQDTAYCAAAPMPMRIVVMGDEGGLELVGDTKLIVRRAVREAGLSAAERIRLGLLAGEGDEVFEFSPAPGEAHEPALTPWLESVRDALRAGRQVATSFDDGLAVAEVMDQLRANLVPASLPG
jgi:predicted dehydrogenase